MKRVIGIVLSVVLLLTLAGCGKKQESQIELSKLDLGVRYLSDGNYEEAIVAFQAAIQIDPKQKDAYLGLADVYVAMNDTEKAIESLLQALDELGDDPEIIAQLEALGVVFEENGVSPETTPDGKIREELGDGYYVLYYENEDGHMVEQFYTPDDVLEYYFIEELDENGIVRVAWEYAADGTLMGVSYINADGTREKSIQYDETGYLVNYPDEDGLGGKHEYYTSDGALQYYVILQYDENGNYVSSVSYYPDGSVMSETGEVRFD